MKAPDLESGNSESKKKSNHARFWYEGKAGPERFQTALTLAILPLRPSIDEITGVSHRFLQSTLG